MSNLERLPIGHSAPSVVNAVIEVPVGSRSKYEYDEELGVMVRDRVLPGAVRYPTDYGFIPSTVAADGEALDVIVAAYDPAATGTVIQVRPVGVLDMFDASGEDRNVLAVPEDDPRFDAVRELGDVPGPNLDEITQFFEVYKRLEGDDQIEIRGWHDVDEARRLIEDSRI